MNAINTLPSLKPDTLIRNPEFGITVVSSVNVAAEANSVWQIVGDFGGFTKFIPALASIEVIGNDVGSLRHKKFKDGLVVVEQLNSRDDGERSMTWTTIYNNLGIGKLWAAMKVEAISDDTNSLATWTIIAEQGEGNSASTEEFQAFLQDFADNAMSNVQSLFA